jgi:hypothetical protein
LPCKNRVLTNYLLRDEHKKAGLIVEEHNEILYLKKDGQGIASFKSGNGTKIAIIKEADKYICK